MSGEQVSATITHRTVVTDSNGNLWDLGNPNIVNINSHNSGADTQILLAGGATYVIAGVSFTSASSVFNAT